jgi:FlaA1/EpsC-like NDP-sugar epimerase
MLKFIFQIPRRQKQGLLFLFDFIVVVFCIFAAFSLRLGYLYFPNDSSNMLIIIAISPLIALPIFTIFGLYNTVIRHVGFQSIWKISQATALYSIIWGLAAFMLANWSAFPRSVVIINWLLIIFMIGGSRLFVRWLVASVINNQKFSQNNVIIFGAGEAGRQLSNALSQSSEYNPVLFIDDSIELQNQSISGLEIYSRDEIGFLIKKNDVKEVLLALPSLSHSNRSKIINFLKSFPVVVRSIPGVSELAKGKIRVNDLHEIDIRDLLGRDIVSANNELLKTNIYKKVVLVTGAGGSIGSEICRQILSLNPAKLIMFDFSESSIYTIDQELNSLNHFNVEIYPVIGSILDEKKINYVCESFKVQTIYHAAAYKHVPLVEQNPSQAIFNNSIGTMIAANCAISNHVETFVLISTDKAVRPTSVMGASKRIAELVLQALDKEQSATCFAIVRFGNVLDSSGSVIPLFKKQIKEWRSCHSYTSRNVVTISL